MTLPTTVLNYRSHPIEAVILDGQKWVRYHRIDDALGFADARAVLNLYKRHEDEFTDEDTRLVSLPTDGGMQEVRVFSLSGAELLTHFARTPQAKGFRRWLRDIRLGRVRSLPRRPMAPLGSETQIVLRDLERLPPSDIPAAITGYLEGARGLPAVGALTELRNERRVLVAEIAERQRKLRDLYLRARRLGYRPETLKWEPPAQNALALDAGEAGDV